LFFSQKGKKKEEEIQAAEGEGEKKRVLFFSSRREAGKKGRKGFSPRKEKRRERLRPERAKKKSFGEEDSRGSTSPLSSRKEKGRKTERL